jgi:predicted nuclease of predicted toxin-antitoxin system
MLGPPPKVVWLDVGNCSNQDLIRVLRARVADIEQFEKHETAAFLTLEL